MKDQTFYKISGKENGNRIDSRVLEEQIQEAVAKGERLIEVRSLRSARHRRPALESRG